MNSFPFFEIKPSEINSQARWIIEIRIYHTYMVAVGPNDETSSDLSNRLIPPFRTSALPFRLGAEVLVDVRCDLLFRVTGLHQSRSDPLYLFITTKSASRMQLNLRDQIPYLLRHRNPKAKPFIVGQRSQLGLVLPEQKQLFFDRTKLPIKTSNFLFQSVNTSLHVIVL
jgi:hypothetical protein